MKKYSSYEMSDKNSYHWVLEEAGATVHAFQDFGSYQGDWLAKVTYNGKTGWIKDCYGSCSGCDAFESESGWKDRTKKEWHEFAVDFAKEYLDDIITFDEVMAYAKKNISWDVDAKNMVEWLEDNKNTLIPIKLNERNV